MAVVGDRVQVPSKRVGQTPREGVVTAVSGGLVRVTWLGGEQSTMAPSMGSLVVVGKVKVRAKKVTPAKKAPSKKAAGSHVKKAAKGSVQGKKAVPKASSKRSGGAPKRGK